MNSKKTKTKTKTNPKIKDLKAKKNPKGGGGVIVPSGIKPKKVIEPIYT